MKSFPPKKPNKDDREKQVLLALVELYLQTGKPVGSQTLKENGLDSLSPATLRNYFVKLEQEGFLKQQHSSGGRIPTSAAFKVYAESVRGTERLSSAEQPLLSSLLFKETREVHLYLQKTGEVLAEIAQGAVFLSAPRFDQDLVSDIKLLGIDEGRLLCVIITDFGTVQTEILLTEKKLGTFALKRIEQFFRQKVSGGDKPELDPEEEKIATALYNEILLRHIVRYSSFSSDDIQKTGFSKMLQYSDLSDASGLASGLALLENHSALSAILQECMKSGDLCFWIGEDLRRFFISATHCSVVAIPYRIRDTIVGALAVLCPIRTRYKKLFAILQEVSKIVETSLTNSLCKFKITYRQPKINEISFESKTALLVSQHQALLLEDKTPKES